MLVLQQAEGQEDLEWRLRESGLAGWSLVEHDPVEQLAETLKRVARLPGCSPIALVPAGRLAVELGVYEALVVVPAEAASRKMESYGDVVSEVRAVVVVGSAVVVRVAMLAVANGAMSVVCVESWEACEVASGGWEMYGLW